jgi:hypothetical protein
METNNEVQKPKHSYFETIYHCGSESMWKVGDILAMYEFYSDREGEHVFGEVINVEMDGDDWCYTFKNGNIMYEADLISEQTYKK